VMEGSCVKIDPNLCYNRFITTNSEFKLPVDIDSKTQRRFLEVGTYQFLFQILLDKLPLTTGAEKLCLDYNVTLTDVISFPCETVHYVLGHEHPQFVFGNQNIYSPISTISISEALIPDKIITEETNERPTEYFIQLSFFDQSIEVIDYDIEFDESILFRKGSKLRIKIIR
ncbi:hypothetical protein M9Y10_011671, partial [Tritrichomonas musculus]